MKKTLLTLAATIGMLITTNLHALAEPVKAGMLMLDNALIRLAPANAPVTGAYVKIHNMGKEPDRLIRAHALFVETTEIHEMVMDGDVMKMRPVEGINIDPQSVTMLQPGGYHIMLIGLKERPKAGETRRILLEFEKAGEVEVDFTVAELDAIRKELGAMKMAH